MLPAAFRCDIFCSVIDNYGDIGVCWRLARILANEHAIAVTLWVDDLHSFARLCPAAEVTAESQTCRGVTVNHWTAEAFPASVINGGLSKREIAVADLVIEAFACKLPESYIVAMAVLQEKPVWINLEYLSAEDWVEGCHKLPSPHPTLPLTRYFFFPGFTKQTGGLLLERDLLARRDAFQRDAVRQQAFWQSIGINMPAEQTLKISLFSYENEAISGLFDAWASSTQSVLCLVPEGRIVPQVGRYFGDDAPCAGKVYARGSLQVRVLPFVEQERYDELLWACDINFVRGEDSLVRAIWAARPFIWHIYPQHDAVHLNKLDALLAVHCEQLSPSARFAMQKLWQLWNEDSELADSSRSAQAWDAFIAACDELNSHAQNWTRQIAKNDLALNLLDFYREIGRIRALKIEGQ